MNDKTKALLASFGRVFAAAVLAAYLTKGKAPLDLRLDDLKSLFNAGVGAALITLVNYLRGGETRFGKGSDNLGMGGEDKLIPPDGVVQPGVLPADGPPGEPSTPVTDDPLQYVGQPADAPQDPA